MPAYILAGGRSSRFGSDKALAHWQGQPLITRIAQAASARCGSVTVVSAAADVYAALGLRTIADVHPGRGPMAGLHAALRDARADTMPHDWLLLLSCDLLELRVDWIDRLLAHRQPGDRALAYRPDRWQPLLALYRIDSLAVVEAMLARDQRAMQPLLDQLSCRAVPLPEDWPAVLQVNRPADFPDAACPDSPCDKADDAGAEGGR